MIFKYVIKIDITNNFFQYVQWSLGLCFVKKHDTIHSVRDRHFDTAFINNSTVTDINIHTCIMNGELIDRSYRLYYVLLFS